MKREQKITLGEMAGAEGEGDMMPTRQSQLVKAAVRPFNALISLRRISVA
jgi:hypothetical protein